MKKILFLITILFLFEGTAFSMIAPEEMKHNIENSEIKTPAVVKKVTTLQSNNGYRIQEVYFEGLYDNAGKKYTAKCHNVGENNRYAMKTVGGPRKYNPKVGQRVFVTIDTNGGEITSMVIMDKDFENRVMSNIKYVKYNCDGAYIEE